MDNFQILLDKNRQKKLSILCVGDSMIDEYYQIEVNRISPEFPMPVMSTTNSSPTHVKLGGVGNVAAQFKHFNVDVKIDCFINSSFRETLIKQQFTNIKMAREFPWDVIKIPVKRRYLEGEIQIIRLDIEEPNYGFSEVGISAIRLDSFNEIKNQDVVIFSDYGKGFFGDLNYLEIYKNSITIVDPKCGSLKKWKGCTIFKPNAKEAKDLSGLNEWKEQSLYFKKALNCEAVVITNSGKSVCGIWKDEFFEYIPEQKVSVRSSVGAGDCFVAFLAMAVGHGFIGVDAVEIAYHAGSKYVQGMYNRAITPAELSLNKIVNPDDLLNRDFKLVFQNGCFDIIHSGHIQALKFAAQKGDKLVVALNSDESIKRLKGESRPVKPLKERLAVMAAIDVVDFVTYFEEDTPLEILQRCKPDVLVKGAQYEGKIIGEEIVPETYRAPMVDGVSTTILLGDKHHRCN